MTNSEVVYKVTFEDVHQKVSKVKIIVTSQGVKRFFDQFPDLKKGIDIQLKQNPKGWALFLIGDHAVLYAENMGAKPEDKIIFFIPFDTSKSELNEFLKWSEL